jgi:hypothetical protein
MAAGQRTARDRHGVVGALVLLAMLLVFGGYLIVTR